MIEDVESWKLLVRSKIYEMIKDWEKRMPPDEDDTLYSLALRRALDVIDTGEIPPLG